MSGHSKLSNVEWFRAQRQGDIPEGVCFQTLIKGLFLKEAELVRPKHI